jgi:hypothetical protein
MRGCSVFINLVQSDVDTVMTILSHFGAATCLKINVAKSSVVPIHCSQINLNEVLANFSGLRASFPISYLGLPITLGWLRICHLQFILNRATTKLSRWHGHMFNIGGRRELVRSILSSIPTYLLTALHAPKHFYKDLDKMRCRFF